jgi:predicted nucleotidyltransferase
VQCLERVRGEVVAALSAITAVRRIDSFGSLATGLADAWSDLDLLVACEDPQATAWLAAGAIRSSKRVAFYRMFTVPRLARRGITGPLKRTLH